jgi:hypothetical protein
MDTYTKGVLTVIAICLVSITFQLSGTQAIKNAYAQTQVEKAVCNVGVDCNANYGPALRIHIVNR